MPDLIEWPELPAWVPGKVLLKSDGLGWTNVGLRSYHYHGQEVVVPAMRDFMLVSYQSGSTPMQRRFDGRWTREMLGPGATSLLTRAQRADWTWREPIDVTHIYLSEALVAEVASEAMDCSVTGVTLADVLRTEDPIMTAVSRAIAEEAREHGLGGPLYVDAMARALIVHLLRRYASVKLSRQAMRGQLTPSQERRIAEFVETHIDQPLDLSWMAEAVGLMPCLFARQFRKSFGKPPYAYVLDRRVARAKELLETGSLPVKQIAAACGFSDQAHMTRLFRRVTGVPPASYRRQHRI